MASSFSDLALIVLTSSASGAILTLLVTWGREHRRTRKAGKFAALFLADALERYARACAEVVQEVRNFDASNGDIGHRHLNIPTLPDYPAIDWSALGVAPAESAMIFRAEVDQLRAELAFLSQVEDGETVEADAVRGALAKGKGALLMAAELRKLKGLKPRPATWYADLLSKVG